MEDVLNIITNFTSTYWLFSLRSNIKEALSEFDPDIIVYNAGTLYFYIIQIIHLGFVILFRRTWSLISPLYFEFFLILPRLRSKRLSNVVRGQGLFSHIYKQYNRTKCFKLFQKSVAAWWF